MADRHNPDLLCEECKVQKFDKDTHWVKCPKCGEYGMIRTLGSMEKDGDIKAKCSVMVRREWEATKEQVVLHTANYKQMVSQYDEITLADKVLNFLQYISDNTTVGKSVKIDNNMYFVTPSITEREIQFIWTHLRKNELIDIGSVMHFSLTFEGWEEVLQEESLIVPNQGFMAMSFTNAEVKADFDNIITPVLKELDLEPFVLLNVEHNEDAVMEILYHIKRSAFVIADIRDDKTNVYYEAGYAKGLGREVIWLCPEELVEKLPFDTRNLNHIVWKTKEELEEKLRKRIMGTVLS